MADLQVSVYYLVVCVLPPTWLGWRKMGWEQTIDGMKGGIDVKDAEPFTSYRSVVNVTVLSALG